MAITMIQKIVNSRAWRGCTVEETTDPTGAGLYKLVHPSGATAIVLKEPGDMDSRKWLTWARRRECERRRMPPPRRRA